MKKIIFTSVLVALLGMFNLTRAQCTISDLKVKLTNVNPLNCEFTFDFSWTQEVNIGNKFAYVHMWTETGYHTPAVNWVNMYSGTSDYPVAADLVNVLNTIVINGNANDIPTIGSIYHPDPSYNLPQPAGLSIVKVHLNNTLIERMTLQNIKVILPACTGAQTIKFDVWASQSANGKNAHCATQGGTLVINEVKVTGLLLCTTPRQFKINLENKGPELSGVTYKVFLDYNPINVIDDGDTLIYTSGSITLPANATWVSAWTDYLPYSNRFPAAYRPLLVEVTLPARPNTSIGSVENSCGPLPVTLNSFTAGMVNDKIQLNWQTATEQYNRGFEVLRKMAGENNFRAIAFVPTQAPDGNSNKILNYSYADKVNAVTQVFYRIRQTDMNDRSNYSEIKMVKISGDKFGLMLYPNPCNGATNMVIPASYGKVDVILNDITGKELKKWIGVETRELALTNLSAGMYMVRVVIKETGEMVMNKLIVQ